MNYIEILNSILFSTGMASGLFALYIEIKSIKKKRGDDKCQKKLNSF